ncbi:TIGR03564 family F420-dependent LLM class oxidoreductase [Pseudonocardia sp.]|uniref:TIGR03564 family F420-dependent LLM class oxidoreductase n=1 Tax=Pseudonocardia sp. TaxID=60912 RepID=UPI0031FBBB2B
MEIATYIGGLAGPTTLEEAVVAARRAADAGLAGVWAAQGLGWDSLTLLALVGAEVSGIRIGSAIVPTPQRHPLVLAGQALSVQAAVGGRFTLGIGAGVGAMVEGMFGLPRDRPALRMREYLAVLNPLLRGEAVDFHGETLAATGQVEVPGAKPPQVLVAALGPEMLRVAGEHADGTATWMTGPRTLADHIVPTVRRAAREAGRGAPRVVAGVLVCVTDDPDSSRDRLASQYELAGQVPEYRAVLDREGAAGPWDVAAIGDEATVTHHLRRLADAGVTELAAAPFGTADEQARTLSLLAVLTPASAARGPVRLSSRDRVAIHELLALHGHLADDRRAEDLGLLLTLDAVYDVQSFGLGNIEGLPAIQDVHRQRPWDQPIGHHVINVVIDERPDGTISVRSTGLSVMADGTAGTCTYDDVVVKTDAGWRIARRRVLPARTD